MKKKLRPYQEEARYWINRQLNNSRNPLLVMPAGSGKTYTSVEIIADRISLKRKLLVLCGTEEIFDQWVLECAENKINYGYINQDGVMGRKKDVYICMWLSLNNILNVLPERFCRSFSEIIIDEAHHSPSATIRNIFNHFSHCQRFGLTATAFRFDNQPLGEFFDEIYEPIAITEAVSKDYLCKPVVILPEVYKNYVPEKLEETYDEETQKVIQDKKIIGDIIKIYKDIFNGLPVMIPCSSHEHAKIVSEMYSKEGWNVKHIHGKLNKTERKKIIRDTRGGKINILTTYSVGTEGLDIKGLAGIIWLRKTMSLTVWIQLNSRAARINEGKKYYVLVDPMGNILVHGSPALDRKWSLDTEYKPGQNNEEQPKMKVCKSCGNMVAHDVLSCWICDYDFETGLLNGVSIEGRKRKLPQMIDGELIFLDKEDDYGRLHNSDSSNDNIVGVGHSHNKSETGRDTENLKKHEKIKILSKDLIGLKTSNKFKEGLKWL